MRKNSSLSAKNVTMQDIADASGFTKATVSMVLSSDKRITEATKQRVLKVVRELGYVPNEAARRLSRGKSDAIAFVAVRFAAPFIASVMDGMEQRAYSRSRYLRGFQPYSTFNQASARDEILRDILLGRKAEAVVTLSLQPSDAICEEYRKKGVPLVLIETDHPLCHSIRVDNASGAYRATQYLIKKGRKRIVFINGVTNAASGEETNAPAVERLQGHKAALKDHGIPWDDSRLLKIKTYEAEEGALAFEQLQRKKVKFDAVFCAAGDVVAMGVMEAARFFKMRIPRDFSLVGFDDVPAAALLRPALSTVHQEFKELGSMAFDIAVEAIEGRLLELRKVLIDPELVIRESA
jgi:LacI family transcriptional regulator